MDHLSASFYARLKRLDALHWLADRWPRLTGPLRMASYAVYRALELLLGRRHPHNRVVAQAKRMQGDAPPASSGGPRVLFFTMRGWYVHVGADAVLAKALQRRGAEVELFLCGGQLEQCDFKPGTDARVTRALCWRCTGFAERLLDAFDLPSTRLTDHVPPAAMRRAREAVADLSRAELLAFEHRGLPLGDWVRPSVHRSLLAGGVGEDDFSVGVLRGFVASAMVLVQVAESLLDRRPDVVVVTNGLFFAERIVLELARRRGIDAVSYERGMLPQTVILDHDRPVVDFDLDPHWPAFRDRPLAAGEEERLDAYLAERAGGKIAAAIDLWPRMQRDGAEVAARLGLDPQRPLAALYSNILWDSAVYGRDVGFDGMLDWVLTTVRRFAAWPERQLVIRVHPAEVRVPLAESRDRLGDRLRDALGSLPANVRLVSPNDPASSYTLLALADVALVYTSTFGLEAALHGKPVVVAGRTHYRGRGFTLDAADREGYPAVIDEAFTRRRLEPGELTLARRYAALFFFHYPQPFPWLVEAPRSERRLTFDRLAALDPGRDPVLDRICDAILDGRPVVVTGTEGGEGA